MTLRTWARLAVVVLAAVLVQVGLLNQIVIGGAHPDAFLMLAISAGLVAGPQRGAILGFTLGLVADVFVQTPYGLSSLCYVLVALATLINQPSVPRHQLAVVAAVVAVTCVLLVNPVCRLLEWTLAVAPGAHRDAGVFAGGSAR